MNGFPSPGLKRDVVILTEGSMRVLLVVHAIAPMNQKRRAERVVQLANLETRYGWASYHASDSIDTRCPHVFLLELDKRLVGFVIAEEREHGHRLSWDEYDGLRRAIELEKIDPVWSICMLWVHRKHRRRGLATLLVKKAIDHLDVSIDDVGWYTPFTETGRAIAQKLCPESFLTVE